MRSGGGCWSGPARAPAAADRRSGSASAGRWQAGGCAGTAQFRATSSACRPARERADRLPRGGAGGTRVRPRSRGRWAWRCGGWRCARAAKFTLLEAADERLTAGFHGYEPAEGLRWTDGYAELPIEAFARFDGARR